MAEYTALAPLFTDIADAIRSKTGKTGKITANSFPSSIANIWIGAGSAGSYKSLPSLFTDIATQIRAKDGTSAKILASDFPSRIRALSYPVPPKGSIISMNLTGQTQNYRILKINGKTIEVIAMFDVARTESFNNSDNTTYNGGDVDLALLSWYDSSLTTLAKNAIVPKNISQDNWYYVYSGDSPLGSPTYKGESNNTGTYYVSRYSSAQYSIGNRTVYALSLDELVEYLNDRSIVSDTSNFLTQSNLWKMFFNQTTVPSGYYNSGIWLRSTVSRGSKHTGLRGWLLNARGGNLAYTKYGEDRIYCRPCFQVDLSKISYTVVQ